MVSPAVPSAGWLPYIAVVAWKKLFGSNCATQAIAFAERKREAAITDTGDRVIRVYPDEIHDEDRVFRKIRRRLSPATVASWRVDPALFRLPHS